MKRTFIIGMIFMVMGGVAAQTNPYAMTNPGTAANAAGSLDTASLKFLRGSKPEVFGSTCNTLLNFDFTQLTTTDTTSPWFFPSYGYAKLMSIVGDCLSAYSDGTEPWLRNMMDQLILESTKFPVVDATLATTVKAANTTFETSQVMVNLTRASADIKKTMSDFGRIYRLESLKESATNELATLSADISKDLDIRQAATDKLNVSVSAMNDVAYQAYNNTFLTIQQGLQYFGQDVNQKIGNHNNSINTAALKLTGNWTNQWVEAWNTFSTAPTAPVCGTDILSKVDAIQTSLNAYYKSIQDSLKASLDYLDGKVKAKLDGAKTKVAPLYDYVSLANNLALITQPAITSFLNTTSTAGTTAATSGTAAGLQNRLKSTFSGSSQPAIANALPANNAIPSMVVAPQPLIDATNKTNASLFDPAVNKYRIVDIKPDIQDNDPLLMDSVFAKGYKAVADYIRQSLANAANIWAPNTIELNVYGQIQAQLTKMDGMIPKLAKAFAVLPGRWNASLIRGPDMSEFDPFPNMETMKNIWEVNWLGLTAEVDKFNAEASILVGIVNSFPPMVLLNPVMADFNKNLPNVSGYVAGIMGSEPYKTAKISYDTIYMRYKNEMRSVFMKLVDVDIKALSDDIDAHQKMMTQALDNVNKRFRGIHAGYLRVKDESTKIQAITDYLKPLTKAMFGKLPTAVQPLTPISEFQSATALTVAATLWTTYIVPINRQNCIRIYTDDVFDVVATGPTETKYYIAVDISSLNYINNPRVRLTSAIRADTQEGKNITQVAGIDPAFVTSNPLFQTLAPRVLLDGSTTEYKYFAVPAAPVTTPPTPANPDLAADYAIQMININPKYLVFVLRTGSKNILNVNLVLNVTVSQGPAATPA